MSMDFDIDTSPVVTPIVLTLPTTNIVTVAIENTESLPVAQILTIPSGINSTIGFAFYAEDNSQIYSINSIDSSTISVPLVLNNTDSTNISITLVENNYALIEFEPSNESSSIISIDTGILNLSTIQLINNTNNNIIEISSNQYIQLDIPK